MQSRGFSIATLGITLNGGESVKSGTSEDFTSSHTFDPSKKITRIVTTICEYEEVILQIKFFFGEELLCEVGLDGWIKENGGRVVTFEIAADEQLIGAELYNGTINVNGYSDYNFFRGVTWLKWKIPN